MLALAVVVGLGSVGVTYAKWADKPVKGGPIQTAQFSDPFIWVASNDDGHEDDRSSYQPIDPGDDGSVGEYDFWGVGDTSSSNDPGSYPLPGALPDPGDPFPRYTKDVARTTARIEADDHYITIVIDNAYPYYYPTVFFALACLSPAVGVIQDIVIENNYFDALTVSYSGIYIGQQIGPGEEAVGALHILVNQEAEQGTTYTIRLSITTICGVAEVECQTAYAYSSVDATCFTDIPGMEHSPWGWSNGPLGHGEYTFDIYAGVGQCIPTEDKKVGTLTVVYDGDTDTVTVTYNLNPGSGYTMDTTHLYVGTEPLPRKKNGDYTTAPGQYGNTHDLDAATTDTYVLGGFEGDPIYVVAHAVVCPLE